MSDVDISPEAAKWALDLRCRVVAYKTDIDIAQFIERQDTELTATQEKLAAAEAGYARLAERLEITHVFQNIDGLKMVRVEVPRDQAVSKCDLCGDHCDGRDLEELRDMYRVAGIKNICPKCSKWANGELRSIRDRIAPTMRQAILDRTGQEPSIWTRVFKLRGVLP